MAAFGDLLDELDEELYVPKRGRQRRNAKSRAIQTSGQKRPSRTRTRTQEPPAAAPTRTSATSFLDSTGDDMWASIAAKPRSTYGRRKPAVTYGSSRRKVAQLAPSRQQRAQRRFNASSSTTGTRAVDALFSNASDAEDSPRARRPRSVALTPSTASCGSSDEDESEEADESDEVLLSARICSSASPNASPASCESPQESASVATSTPASVVTPRDDGYTPTIVSPTDGEADASPMVSPSTRPSDSQRASSSTGPFSVRSDTSSSTVAADASIALSPASRGTSVSGSRRSSLALSSPALSVRLDRLSLGSTCTHASCETTASSASTRAADGALWSQEEHQRLQEALQLNGIRRSRKGQLKAAPGKWKRVQVRVGTKTLAQCKTYAAFILAGEPGAATSGGGRGTWGGGRVGVGGDDGAGAAQGVTASRHPLPSASGVGGLDSGAAGHTDRQRAAAGGVAAASTASTAQPQPTATKFRRRIMRWHVAHNIHEKRRAQRRRARTVAQVSGCATNALGFVVGVGVVVVVVVAVVVVVLGVFGVT